MRRMSELPGVPVFANDGRRVGKIEEAVFLPGTTRLSGFLIQRTGLWNGMGTSWVSMNEVSFLGRHSVILAPLAFLSKAGKRNKTDALRAFAPDGRELGRITDLLLDGRNGAVLGYELSRGWWEDWRDGRQILWAYERSGIS